MSEIPPIFVSVGEAARILGLSKWSVYDLLDKELIESQYHRSKRMVRFASLQAYADALPTEKPGKVESA